MSQSVEYVIAQYLRDPVRREPKNIGVIVFIDDLRAGMFLGERFNQLGEIDARSARWAKSQDVYRKWLKYWRQEIRKGGEGLKDRLMKTNGDNYDIIPGGVVTDAEGSSLDEICRQLFPMLVDVPVTEPQDADDTDDDASLREFRREISTELRRLQILAGANVHLNVPNPIHSRATVPGTRAQHRPAYYQRNGSLYVMETVNFATIRKAPATDHAALALVMIDDIRERNIAKETHGIVLIRAENDDYDNRHVKYALALLDGRATVVNWNVDQERRQFLNERREAAFEPHAE